MEMTRREMLAGAAGAIAVMAAGGCASVAASSPPPGFAYVGCYTTKQRNGRGEGIGVYSIDPVTLAWTRIQLLGTPDNPSWLTLDRRQQFLYCAHGDGPAVTAFRIDRASGQLIALGSRDAMGRNGVRLGVDASNKFVICANYASSSVSVLPIQPDGTLGPVSELVLLPGKPGPHRTQQPSSQPHDVVFDPRDRFFLVPDKGVDAIFVFSLDTVFTAVGLANRIEIMVAAIVFAIVVMLVLSAAAAALLERQPGVKRVGLALLVPVGASLCADGLGWHVPKGWLYGVLALVAVVGAALVSARQRRAAQR